jgi:hypothetical protein
MTNAIKVLLQMTSVSLQPVPSLLVIQNDCGQVWQLCTKIYVATL